MNIFLSFSFNYGHELTKAVERLLSSHDIGLITGRKLGGAVVDAGVEKKIREADALISLFTARPNPGQGEGAWSQAVQEEYDFARNQQMYAIAVVEQGLKFGGMSNKERINYDPTNPTEALLGISETIAEWRRTMGQDWKVQILPDNLAERLENDARLTCSHRYWDRDIPTPWRDVLAVPEDEGTFIYLRGVRPTQRIELRVTGPKQKVAWASKIRLPWPMVQLKEKKNG